MTKKVIVIGATSGIGHSIARTYIKRGYKVGVAGRREERLEELRNEFPEAAVVSMQIDVTTEDFTERLKQLVEKMGGADLVVYSSGYGVENMKLDEQTSVREINVNVSGFVKCVGFFFNYWCDNHLRGHFVVMSSVAGIRALGVTPGYSSTKHFQAFYLESLRQLAVMRGADICFTSIKPGFVDTDFIAGRNYPLTQSREKSVEHIIKAIDARRKNCVIYGKWKWIAILMKSIPAPLWRAIGKLTIVQSDRPRL